MENKNQLTDEAKAFVMDADRLERMHNREIAMKNRTPEQIAFDKKEDEKAEDIQKVLDGKMSEEEYMAKWNK